MIQNPNRKNIEDLPASRLLAGLVVFNLVLKLILLPLNQAEYTDGILQLTLFKTPNRLYPPLFTLLSLVLKPILGDAETAGRLVSAVSSTLLVIPVFLLCRWIFNKRSAFFAGLIYTVSPVALRWSGHAMTDALFSLLFFASVLFWIRAWQDKKSRPLIWCTVFAILATLTRYQGILLFPPVAFLVGVRFYKRKSLAWKEIGIQLLWALPVLWAIWYGFRHPGQFMERAGASPWSTFVNMVNLFESFLCYSPYFLTWPVCFVLLYGLFHLGLKDFKRLVLLCLFLYLLVALLVLQSAFSSFQSRYLLPLLPFVCLFAGWGLSRLHEQWRNGVGFKILFVVTILYPLLFGLGSLFLQRETFSDLKEAALYVKKLPKETMVYSNETYKDIGPVKMRYWSGREILHYSGEMELPSGAVLCLSSSYGGLQGFTQVRQWLEKEYGPERLAYFEASVVPLLPEVMQEPFSHQNPLALTFRYTPQYFRTEVYRIP